MNCEKIRNYFGLIGIVNKETLFLRSLEPGKYFKSIEDLEGNQNVLFITKEGDGDSYAVNLLDKDRNLYKFDIMKYRVVVKFFSKLSTLADLIIHQHVYNYQPLTMIKWNPVEFAKIKSFGKLGNNTAKTKRICIYYQEEFQLLRKDLYIETM